MPYARFFAALHNLKMLDLFFEKKYNKIDFSEKASDFSNFFIFDYTHYPYFFSFVLGRAARREARRPLFHLLYKNSMFIRHLCAMTHDAHPQAMKKPGKANARPANAQDRKSAPLRALRPQDRAAAATEKIHSILMMSPSSKSRKKSGSSSPLSGCAAASPCSFAASAPFSSPSSTYTLSA